MKRIKGSMISCCLCLCLLVPAGLWALSDRDMIRLKENGVSDETLATIIREKTVETCALRVSEIIALKRAGLDASTLQTIIREKAARRDTGPIVYGRAFEKPRFVSPEQIVALKKAGVSDSVIRTLIIRGALGLKDANGDQQSAWRMLENMNLEMEAP